MKRNFVALILMLAVTLQGSLLAFANASAQMPSNCITLMASTPHTPQDACCSSVTHALMCCQDACPATAAVIGSFTAPLIFYGRPVPALPIHTEIFSSRGESPLIRPPIL